MFTYVCNAANYTNSWTETKGKHLFDKISLSNDNYTVTYTINTQAGTTFSFHGFLSASTKNTATISIDNSIEQTYSSTSGEHFDYTHTFTSGGSHTIAINKSERYGSLSLSDIIVAHPSNVSAVQNITLNEAGDLKYYLTDDKKYYVTKLSITGPLNGEDMTIIRDLGTSILSELKILDLSGAHMRSGGGACGTYVYTEMGSYGEYDCILDTYTQDDYISAGLFCFLDNLVEVTLPESVTGINYGAFRGCKNLEKVTMGNSISAIGKVAFARCEKLNSIVFSSSTTIIEDEAFAYCSNLVNLSIPEGTKSIGREAFNRCTALTTVSIPSSVIHIYDDAFMDCNSINRVNISNLNSWCAIDFNTQRSNPTYYSKRLYLDNSSSPITSLLIPDGVNSIGSYCFINCSNIQSVSFPSTVTSVGQLAFEGCTSITEVSAPSIAAWCAIDFTSNEVWFDVFDSDGNVAYGYDSEDGYYEIGQSASICKSNPLYYSQKLYINHKLITSLEIPEGIQSIGRGAFAHCKSISSVTIPKSLTTIGALAFYDCSNISNVTINNIDSWNKISFKTSFCLYSTLGEKYYDYYDDRYFYDYTQDTISEYSSNPVYATCTSSVPDITKVQWSSASPSVAAINSNGAITALSAGSSVITSMSGGIRTFCNFNVAAEQILVQSITLSEPTMDLKEGEIKQLIATVFPNNADDQKLSWKSSDESIATVDENGLVTAIAPGTATFTATAADGSGVSASCTVTVNEVTPEPPVVDDGGNTDISKYDNVIYIENAEAMTGGKLTLSMKMNNKIAMTGFQCDVYFPEGVTVAKDEDDFNLVGLSLQRTTAQKTNYFDSVEQPDGCLRIMCSSTKSYTFSGNEGEVATITVNVSEDMEDGEYPLIIKNIVMSDASSNTYEVEYVKTTLAVSSYTLGDANNDMKINVGDFTAIANAIMGNPSDTFVEKAADVNEDGKINVGDLTGVANLILYGTVTPTTSAKAYQGNTYLPTVVSVDDCNASVGTEFTVAIDVKGNYGFSAYQFDMVLPEGISVKMNGNEPCAWLSTVRTNEKHTNFFASEMVANNIVRVLAASTNGYKFEGNEGSVAYVTLVADHSVVAGDYSVGINNIILSANGETIMPDATTFGVRIGDSTGIKDVLSDDANLSVYDLSGKIVKHVSSANELKKGVYIVNGKKIVK